MSDYNPNADRADTDLSISVERLVSRMALSIFADFVEDAQEFELSTVDANELTTDEMTDASMPTVFDVIDDGPLTMDHFYADFQTYDDFEKAVRHFAAINLQHMVLDRVEVVANLRDGGTEEVTA